MAEDLAAERAAGLTKLFNGVVHGHRDLKSTADGNRFLEAFYTQPDASKCVESLKTSKSGLSAMAKSFRFSSESSFMNGPAACAILSLAQPSLKQLYNGQPLRQILEQIVYPPSFWNAFLEAHDAYLLTPKGVHAFAWLLLELLQIRSEQVPENVREVAQQITESGSFIRSDLPDVRTIGQKIKYRLDFTNDLSDDDNHPGGRHDNDFADYRLIKLLPTPDEFSSSERPFYRRADAVDSVQHEQRGIVHLDNQFRLLREDLLGELRNDFQIATGQKKGRHKLILENLELSNVNCGTSVKRKSCSLEFQCLEDIPQLRKIRGKNLRKKHISENKNLMKHLSFGCLISGGKAIAFAVVDRDEDLLASEPPVIILRVADPDSFGKVLKVVKTASDLSFAQVETAVFAYEPILKRLQSMTELPMDEQLLHLTDESAEALSGIQPQLIVEKILNGWEGDLQAITGTNCPVHLDFAQAESLIAGLTKKVSLIQGPPGTGKSFIGALIAKILHDHTQEKILILTYTNHALDQFLEDILNVDVPPSSIVRLGQKSTPNTESLGILKQPNNYKMARETWRMIESEKTERECYYNSLTQKMNELFRAGVSNQALLSYLEFSEDSEYFDAFTVPETDDGMTTVGRNNAVIEKKYLIDRWSKGQDAGVFVKTATESYPHIWKIEPKSRLLLRSGWLDQILNEHVSEVTNLMKKYDACHNQIQLLHGEKRSHIIEQKRIIGCTTTAAAMNAEYLERTQPGIILVEEAGEILESHILTALTSSTKQLILIGDHKQLRPKVNNYSLTVEKGDGYDLNVSLFERLVLGGVKHTTLNKQHRMRPEISSFVRFLTYPELEDADKTKGRPSLRGFQDNIIFVSHTHPELNADRIADRRDEGAKSSKENEYEADMVLKCVRYLGQQGYGTDDIVILTPYLGQLFLLQNTLSAENDPVLNDLDSHDLIRAGLLTPAGANISKRKIRISTIDNYQGEESKIVITCLTRSNQVGDIGFMSSPQRVNVLLSRARDALIMIGNADTFMNSRKGRDVWSPLMEKLKKGGHVYDGFPVKCEKHPDKLALLKEKKHFDLICPDGGCSEECGVMLNCNLHTCPHRCHQLQDHSEMNCKAIISSKCSQGHTINRKCYNKAAMICRKCEAETRAKEKRRQLEYKLDQERQAKQEAYSRRLTEIDDEIERQKRLLKDQTDEQDRQHSLAQKEQDLASFKAKVEANEIKISNEKPEQNKPDSLPANTKLLSAKENTLEEEKTASATPSTHIDKASSNGTNGAAKDQGVSTQDEASPEQNESAAKDEWEWQKQFEGAANEALDSLMPMIGLELVKQQFLDIKAKVDTVVRQQVSLKGERFGATLLGNPGTGKTTVARIYAKFLVEVGCLPGDHFFETSGSALANEGVSACKAHIDKILEAGGGVFFIDEAYQLVSGNSHGGKAVLDYLLAEIENHTSRIVFVLAGYHKQMEAFFMHNPGIPSRIPIEMTFQDYSDQELQAIFCHYVDAKYRGNMRIDGGMHGLYVRIVARRIGRGRGRDGFGNAREVQNVISKITKRQAKRLHIERRAGLLPDDKLLTKEDLIGPEPSGVLKDNAAWAKLKKLIGLNAVKKNVQALLDGIQINYQRELEEKPIVQYSLNRCFIGSPGTGKTSVAKLYGRILADIGLLSNGEVIVKNPADFVGSVLGGSESNTKAILAATVGKVLIIDEAYMLANGTPVDPYKAAVIDTIVAEVQSTPGEDRCVLLLGYEEEMGNMIRDANPGLARRFPMESAFVFEDFNDAEIRQILDLKLKDIGFEATDQSKGVAMDVIARARNLPNFGNAGEVDIILDRAKALHQKHLNESKVTRFDTLEAIDFDPDFSRGERAATNLPALFRDVVGCEDLIQQFQRYQKTAANMKALGMNPREQLPFNFLFKGPPGTGKTTTAQKMGKVFYDMGLLSQAKVEECSTADMIGQYVGQTSPKVRKLLEKAMGKVLFIDEAYRLAEGPFATEAMDELVTCLTSPKFQGKLITILAGYDKDIDRLMSMNPGLTSRFPESVIFSPLDPKTCFELLVKTFENLLKKKKAPLDFSILSSPTVDLQERILHLFRDLSALDSWGNARDVKFIAGSIFGKLISEAVPPITGLVLTETHVVDALQAMLQERRRRNEAAGTSRFHNNLSSWENKELPTMLQKPSLDARMPDFSTKTASPPPTTMAEIGKQEDHQAPEEAKATPKLDAEDPIDSIFKAQRDPSVSDAVWEQLERDKHTMIAKEREYQRLQEEKRQEEERIEQLKRAEKAAADEEERRIREAERIAAEQERRRREEVLAAIERARQQEIEMRKKIQALGRCPAGFEWIRQAGGYRCAGGSHFLDDAALGI